MDAAIVLIMTLPSTGEKSRAGNCSVFIFSRPAIFGKISIHPHAKTNATPNIRKVSFSKIQPSSPAENIRKPCLSALSLNFRKPIIHKNWKKTKTDSWIAERPKNTMPGLTASARATKKLACLPIKLR